MFIKTPRNITLLMEQELPTLPERMSSPLIFSAVCVAQFLSKYAKFSYWHKLIEK
jgi:hypothetical protein